MSFPEDIKYMRRAISLARRGLGRVWPNPSVGCVLVKDGKVLAQTRTADGGRPHAEFLALGKAGDAAQGATAYVTLEPCRHETTTPSCAKSLIEAGIKRVVIGCLDPDPRTAGRGMELLSEAGIDVECGILENSCIDLNIGFIFKINKKKPFINVKTATSLDGKIAMSSGESKWITGDEARKHVHQMRGQYDAILTGIGTILNDDPQMNVRLSRKVSSPVRVILDSHLQTPLGARILSPDAAVYIFYQDGDAAGFAEKDHVHLVQIDPRNLADVLTYLAMEVGITRLMVEAGAAVTISFLRAGFCDRLSWYRAPIIMGGDTYDLTKGLSYAQLSECLRLERRAVKSLEQDLLEIYEDTQ